MNLPCEVIADLLPLYSDGACSEQSAALVEEHICSCEKCKKALADMSEPYETKNKPDEEQMLAKSIFKIQKKLNRKIIFRSTAIALALFCAFFSVWSVFEVLTKLNIVSVGAEDFEISNLICVEEGKVLSFSFEALDGKGINIFDTEMEGNVLYVIPKRNFIEKDGGQSISDAERLYLNIMSESNDEIVRYFDISTQLTDRAGEIEKIYIGSKSDNILLWEEGMDIPSATQAELEAYRALSEMARAEFMWNYTVIS